MRIIDTINENIFRGYDIRGIYGKDLDEDVAYTIGKAFGTKLIHDQKTSTVIGHDNRNSSPILYKALVQGIIDTGIDVVRIGLVTTPMYYFALDLFKKGSGIMITGSHNPKDENGFKISFNGIYNAYGEYIQEFKRLVLEKNYASGKGNLTDEDIKERYINYILSSIDLGTHKLKLVIDCGNGTGSIIIKDVFDRLNVDYIPLFCDSNPEFPNHHPDPSVEENLTTLKQKVVEEKADLGIAYDGDADRVGLVNEKGEMIPSDYFMIIVARYLLNKLDDKRILFDLKCSKVLEDEIIKLGGTPICNRTGNSYMRARVYEEKIPLGVELSGHIWFNDKFYGFDDGVYNSLRMIEILSHTDKFISALLEGIEKYYSTNEIKMATPDNIKFDKVDKVTQYCQDKGYKTLTIDGCKALFEDGSALVRASNTGPNITMRFEAKTEKRLKELEDEFTTLLNNI